jgi:hypothetical protein
MSHNFFLENEKKFSGHTKLNFSGDYIILPQNNKIFQDIPKYKNKCNLSEIKGCWAKNAI